MEWGGAYYTNMWTQALKKESNISPLNGYLNRSSHNIYIYLLMHLSVCLFYT